VLRRHVLRQRDQEIEIGIDLSLFLSRYEAEQEEPE
jgi:hypothetical protein